MAAAARCGRERNASCDRPTRGSVTSARHANHESRDENASVAVASRDTIVLASHLLDQEKQRCFGQHADPTTRGNDVRRIIEPYRGQSVGVERSRLGIERFDAASEASNKVLDPR